MVGVAGFEPAAPCSQSRCATRLRHTPNPPKSYHPANASANGRRKVEASMTTFPKGEDAWTREQVNAVLRAVEDMFHRRDVDALVKGFTEDCVVRFAEQPERRGREALRALFTAR